MATASLIKVLNVSALIAMMLSVGLSVHWEQVRESARQTRSVVLGLLANFALVPLVTVGLLSVFRPDPLVSTGFLILAVCPGAPLGPAFCGVARGDVPFATGSMVLLAGLSVLLAPLLLSALVGWLAPNSEVRVGFFSIALTLSLTQFLPLTVGLALHRMAPDLAQATVRPIRALGNVLLLALLAAIMVSQFEALAAIRLRGWLGMGALLAASLVIGWFCGGAGAERRKSMALTTATRNIAVGLAIVANSLPGTPAATAVVAYGLFSTVGALLCTYPLRRIGSPRSMTDSL